MSTLALAKNLLLSMLGLAVVWFFAVSIPLLMAGWDSALFANAMRPIQLLAWIPIILGAGVIVWCYCLFVFVGGGTPWPFDPPKRLVIAGPYRFVRNPMEAGFLLMILGEALLLGSMVLIPYWIISLGLLYARQVLIDEPALRRRFGPPYERYMKSVPRYVPRLRAYREDS